MKTLNWHNPDNLTDEQIGTKYGWRLLLREELIERTPTPEIQAWCGELPDWDSTGWQGSINLTYRVQWPLPGRALSTDPVFPEGLPPLPKLPAGWRWELKGWGWRGSERCRYGYFSPKEGFEWRLDTDETGLPSPGVPMGESANFYILAVEDKQEGWIKWSDRQPACKDYPIKVVTSGSSGYLSSQYHVEPGNPESFFWMHDDTPPIPPPIPPREPTQEEKDEIEFQKYWDGQMKSGKHRTESREAFMEGLRIARKQP